MPRRALFPLLLFVAGCGTAPAGVAGLVRDAAGPVSGATVRFRGSAESTRTGPDGHFRLPTHPGRITAAREGYHIAASDPVPGLALLLRPVPARDNEAYDWVNPTPDPARAESCGNCHARAHAEWSGSAHASSAVNPRFRAFTEGTDAHGRPGVGWSLAADNPDGAGVCLSCHAPTSPPSVFDVRDLPEGPPRLGVHCDFCHKAAGWADGAVPGLTHGRYALRLARPDLAAGEEQVILGPLDDADRPENAFSPFQRDSRLCAACHEGTVFGVPVYTTFSEWRESLAGREGRSCQSCHLPAADGHVNAAPDHGGIDRDPSALSNHTLFAGSRSEMLRRALRLRVTVRHGTGGPTAEVELLAVGVGHRVPTGFIDRNLTLEVQGYDADGRPLGPAAKRLFARQLRDEAGRSPVPFWRPGVTADDTRLRPGEPDRSRHILPVGTHRVRARVVARRFWPEVVAEKGWPPEATVAAEAEAVVGE